MNAAKFFRWAAALPVAIALILLATDSPGLDVHREHLRVLISYTDPARATAVVALMSEHLHERD